MATGGTDRLCALRRAKENPPLGPIREFFFPEISFNSRPRNNASAATNSWLCETKKTQLISLCCCCCLEDPCLKENAAIEISSARAMFDT